ncbi:hypothetical protein THRCLA_22433 [Thraustotheca clavata]|uniref:PH domain-containing protein n=1 Tax=Thraustotheca clavata TaxID=74557 RepID=A0A1V9Z1Q6_9STRA|nr:hypothetical protein THRCLA_22433 [Thraustotheca clavata]
MLLTMDSLLKMAAKVPAITIEEHMKEARRMEEDGILLPQLTQLNYEVEAEIFRHGKAIRHHNDLNNNTIRPSLRSPSLRRRGSLVLDMGSLVESVESPRSSTHTSPRNAFNSSNYQSLFLTAALQLLEEKGNNSLHDQTIATLETKLPHDTILAGYLKKAKDNSLRTSTKKYVILTQGVLTYYADVNTTTNKKVPTTDVILVSRRYICRENLSQRFQNKFAFELIASDTAESSPHAKRKTRIIWMAKSENERRIWVQAIRSVINNMTISPSVRDHDCYEFLLLQRQLKDAKSKSHYLHALNSIKQELDVPVEWVHQQADSRNHIRCGMDQVFKDLGRDKVKINSRVYSGADGTECVIGALASAFMDVHNDQDEILSEAQALGIVRSILLSCNRTQSGGDTYETVDFLYHNESLIVLCPSSLEALPLEINIFLHDSCPELTLSMTAANDFISEPNAPPRESSLNLSSKNDLSIGRNSMATALSLGDDFEANFLPSKALSLFGKDKEPVELVSFAGKKIHINIVAETSYNICDTNPQGDITKDTWATIKATFKQSFVYVPHYGVLEGKGFVRVNASNIH